MSRGSSRVSSGGHGPGQRQLRAGEVIRHALAGLLLKGWEHDPEIAHVSITVSEVRMSPDLRVATVFALPLGGLNTGEVIAALDRNRAEIRRAVTRLIAMKFSPELRFAADGSFDAMDRTRDLLGSDPVRRDL